MAINKSDLYLKLCASCDELVGNIDELLPLYTSVKRETRAALAKAAKKQNVKIDGNS